MLRIGRLSLGKSPTIAVTITDSEKLASIRKARNQGAHLLEIRIDRFRNLSEGAILKRIRTLRRLGMPLLATIRSSREGGGRKLSDAKRAGLFKKVIPEVDAIDLELSSTGLVKVLVPFAHRKGRRVILSYHNFRSTPSDGGLQRILREGKRKKGDLIKMAVTPKKAGEVARLLLFTFRHRDENLITIAMGPRGVASRILAPLFGSRVTYSFVSRPYAPGQIPLSRLLQAWHLANRPLFR